MPTPIPCQPCCTTPQVVNIPGVDGADGASGATGANGINAYSITAAQFIIPATANNVTVTFTSANDWMVVGQSVVIGQGNTFLTHPGPAHFKIISVNTVAFEAVLQKLAASGDAATGQPIDAGANCSPAGAPGPTGAAGASGAIILLGSGVGLAFTNSGSDALIITGFPALYAVTQILVYGSSGSLTGAKGGIYGNVTKNPPVIVLSTQAYAAVSAAGIWLTLPLASAALSGQQALTNPNMYLHLDNPTVGNFTANVNVYGYDLT